MTHKIWQKELKLNFSKDVIDIVQFGSSLIENSKPNDIDIAVIFDKIPLKNQLIESQKIKRQLEKLSEIPIHMNSFDFYSLFDKSNFAKDNLLFLGKSILSNDFFVKRFGLKPRVQIYYSLFNLDKKDKVRFNYMLNGRKGVYGLLRKYNGVLLKPGLIEVLPEYEELFVLGIKKFGVKFEVKRVFCWG